MSRSSIGKNIREAREAQGLTQKDLAERITISRPQIANIESGNHNPSLESLQEIAAALEVRIDDLLDEDTVLAELHHRSAEPRPAEYVLTLRLRVKMEYNKITRFVVEDAVANKVKTR